MVDVCIGRYARLGAYGSEGESVGVVRQRRTVNNGVVSFELILGISCGVGLKTPRQACYAHIGRSAGEIRER